MGICFTLLTKLYKKRAVCKPPSFKKTSKNKVMKTYTIIKIAGATILAVWGFDMIYTIIALFNQM